MTPDPHLRADHSAVRETTIVCGADAHYALPLAVVLQSAVETYRGAHPLAVHVIDGGMRPEQRRRIARVLDHPGVTLSWISPRYGETRGLPTRKRFSEAMYLRLLIPTLLPRADRAIYLDCDVLVEADLAELAQTDISDALLAAAQDPVIPTVSSPEGLPNYRELGLAPDALYFNSGVLVLNLKQWREENVAASVFEYVRRHADLVRWPDQDGLNAVAVGRWMKLDRRWNIPPQNAAPRAPQIVHFLGWAKPWNTFGIGPAGERWRQCLRRSGYLSAVEWHLYATRVFLRSAVRAAHMTVHRLGRSARVR